MPPDSRPMTDAELAEVLEDQISDAVDYNASTLAKIRRKALRYYEGDENLDGDVPVQRHRSAIVSRDMSDTHGWIMPSLLRVFLGGDRVVMYEPRRPDAEEGAKQATDFVNYLFLSECSGYAVVHAALWDGLSYGNGIIKHWWDETPEYRMESLSGISEMEYIRQITDPNVEVLEHSERNDQNYNALADGGGMVGELASTAGSTIPPGGASDSSGIGSGVAGLTVPRLHDLKIRRKTSNGCLKLCAVPHEEFRLDRNATVLDEDHVRFCAHVGTRTRSRLIAEGYPRALVDSLAASSVSVLQTNEDAARGGNRGSDNPPDKSTDLIEVWECYVCLDYDGDGVAEWRRVVVADGDGSGGKGSDGRVVLYNEEWGDMLPFTDLVPDPMPHRWRGGSLFDEVGDIQRGKTILLRGFVDNLRWVNNPQRQAVADQILPGEMAKLLNPAPGDVVLTRAPGAIADLSVPFIGDKMMIGMELLDKVREFRTGVSAATMSLDPEALANQTATAVNAAQTAAYSKVETYARNIAEVGMKRLFRCILHLVVQNQDQARWVRLRGKLVQMDPRGWDADMDVVINVGLGSGSRDRDMAMLNVISGKQELVVQGLGPMVAAQLKLGPDKVFATYRKLVEAAGIKSPETFFPEITEDDVNRLVEKMGQQPNSQQAESEARIQLIHAQIAHIGANIQKAQADAATAAVKAQNESMQTQADAQRGLLDIEHVRAQIESLRSAALANMTKAGAIQSDAQINQYLARLEALDHLVSWHHDQQKLHNEANRMRREVQTPGVNA